MLFMLCKVNESIWIGENIQITIADRCNDIIIIGVKINKPTIYRHKIEKIDQSHNKHE